MTFIETKKLWQQQKVFRFEVSKIPGKNFGLLNDLSLTITRDQSFLFAHRIAFFCTKTFNTDRQGSRSLKYEEKKIHKKNPRIVKRIIRCIISQFTYLARHNGPLIFSPIFVQKTRNFYVHPKIKTNSRFSGLGFWTKHWTKIG